MNPMEDERLFGENREAAAESQAQRPRKRRAPAATSRKPSSFEQKYERLQAILDEIEREDIPLERLLKLFEEGVGLVRDCSAYLEEARLKVESYLELRDGSYVIKGLESPGEE